MFGSRDSFLCMGPRHPSNAVARYKPFLHISLENGYEYEYDSFLILALLGSVLYNLVLSNHLLLTTKTLSIFPYLFRNELLDNLDDYTPEELEIDSDLEIELDWYVRNQTYVNIHGHVQETSIYCNQNGTIICIYFTIIFIYFTHSSTNLIST